MALMLALVVAVQRFARFPAQTPADYAAMEPAFDIRQHLSGPMTCEGVIYGPMGRVTSRFTANMHGTWDGDSGTLAEHFRYDSGTTQDREWRLTLQSGGRIRAEADDLVGRGRSGNAGRGRATGAVAATHHSRFARYARAAYALDVNRLADILHR